MDFNANAKASDAPDSQGKSLGELVRGAMDADTNGTAVSRTRGAMSQPIGMIIRDIIGDDRISTLFHLAGKHPDEYEGQPTGDIALKLGVISANTKTALLLAQAAERTFALAEKAGDIAARHKTLVETLTADGMTVYLDQKRAGVMDLNDPIFKYVGSARDPEILREAQATWMAAQAYLNHEVSAVNDEVFSPDFQGSQLTQGPEAATGFKLMAMRYYDQAAMILRDEGHNEAAGKLGLVAHNMGYHDFKPFSFLHPLGEHPAMMQAGHVPLPRQFLQDLLASEHRAVQDANIFAGENKHTVSSEWESTLKKLIDLTSRQNANKMDENEALPAAYLKAGPAP